MLLIILLVTERDEPTHDAPELLQRCVRVIRCTATHVLVSAPGTENLSLGLAGDANRGTVSHLVAQKGAVM